MNDLILGIPVWIWITTSLILSIIEAPFVARIDKDHPNEVKITFVMLNPLFLFAPAFIILFIGILVLIWKIPEFISNYIKSRKKDKNIDEPIEIFANFDSSSTVRYYSIKKGSNEIKIVYCSMEFLMDIKECLERKEITWDAAYRLSHDSIYGVEQRQLKSKIDQIKESRIINKIKLD